MSEKTKNSYRLHAELARYFRELKCRDRCMYHTRVLKKMDKAIPYSSRDVKKYMAI